VSHGKLAAVKLESLGHGQVEVHIKVAVLFLMIRSMVLISSPILSESWKLLLIYPVEQKLSIMVALIVPTAKKTIPKIRKMMPKIAMATE